MAEASRIALTLTFLDYNVFFLTAILTIATVS